MNAAKKMILGTMVAFVLVFAAQSIPGAIDLTVDQRHTLSNNTITKLQALEKPIRIDVFLTGQIPAQYQHFSASVAGMLHDFEQYTDVFSINFIDPFAQGTPETIVEEMESFGLQYFLSQNHL